MAAITPSTIEAIAASPPPRRNQGMRGTRAPPAKVSSEVNAAFQGDPSSSGSMPRERAYTARARSGISAICWEGLCVVAGRTPSLWMNSASSCLARSGARLRWSRYSESRRRSSSTCAAMDTYSPTAMDTAPATSEANPASSTTLLLCCAPATPRIRATLVTSPSLTPSTAARVAPLCTSRARCRSPRSAGIRPQRLAQLRQRGEGGVFRGEQRVLDRPLDAHAVPARADLVRAVVEVRALVFDFRHLAEHAETVRETRGNEDLPEVLLAQPVAHPLAEGRRAGPDVDGDVEDLSAHRAHQLPLRSRSLRMQAAQRPPHRARVVVLHEVVGDAALAVARGMERLHEEAAGVAEDVRLDDQHPRQLRRQDLQGSPLEAVSVTAHGEEVARLLRVHFQLDPQRADEVVDRPRGALVLRAPAARKDVVAAERAAGGGEEQPQHPELLPADVDGGAVPGDELAVEIDLHRCEPDHRALFRSRRPPAQQGLDAREQLAEPERLAQVVVGAELQAEDLVALHALGGQHQDGSGGTLLSHLLEQLVAVAARKHDVENDQVDVRLERHAQAGLAVLGDAHFVAVPAQVEAAPEGDGAGVFDDEDARHREPPVCRREEDAERAALSDPAVQLDAPTVQLDDLLC